MTDWRLVSVAMAGKQALSWGHSLGRVAAQSLGLVRTVARSSRIALAGGGCCNRAADDAGDMA
jgi:hypothetical protein